MVDNWLGKNSFGAGCYLARIGCSEQHVLFLSNRMSFAAKVAALRAFFGVPPEVAMPEGGVQEIRTVWRSGGV